MIKIAICEDEIIHRTILEDYLNTILINSNIKYEILTFESGEELVENYKKDIDIILLDILMGNLTGMDVARKIRKFDDKVEIIFVTSLVDYIQEGYEVRAYRYLIKPIVYEELERHILSCVNGLLESNKNYIVVKYENEIHKILVHDITYVEIIRKDMTIHTIKKKYEIRMTLKKMEEELSRDDFFRCHKSYLVNMNQIQSLKQDSVIVNSNEVPVSRHRMRDLKVKLSDVLGDVLC